VGAETVGEVGRPQWAERRRCWSALADRTNRWEGRLRQWPAADACGRSRSLRPGGVACVGWWFGAAPNEDAPDQGDLIATSTYLG